MESSSKAQKQDGVLLTIEKINQKLRGDFFCCPPYGSINGEWLFEAMRLSVQEPDKLKFHVTKEITLPWRRAYQAAHMYLELDIVKPYRYIIDSAVISFLEGNWVCSYLSLIPVIEGVLETWRIESGVKRNKDSLGWFPQYLSTDVYEKLRDDIYLHAHLKKQCEFACDVLKNDFYERGSLHLEVKGANMFNRNVPLHMMSVPKHFDSGLGVARLLLLLDIICDLYLNTNFSKYKKLGACLFNEIVNKDEHDAYFELFKKCSYASLYSANINFLHNKFYTGGA